MERERRMYLSTILFVVGCYLAGGPVVAGGAAIVVGVILLASTLRT